MSVVEYHTLREGGSPSAADKTDGSRKDNMRMRYRGWVLLALGAGSWVGLFKIFGWY